MSIVVEHRPLSCYNQERHLLSVAGEIFRNCKGFEESQFYKINEELWCGALVLKQTFQLDQPLLCYKVVPTWHLQSISSFSSNDFTRWSPSMPQKMPNFSGQCAFLYLLCILIWYSHSSPSLFTCGTRILATASIQGWRVFRSARPGVRRQFESGVWSSKYGTCLPFCLCMALTWSKPPSTVHFVICEQLALLHDPWFTA